MDHKIVAVIFPVSYFICTKRHISDYAVEKAVRIFCRFKPLHGNIIFLVELLCNLSGNAVQLYAIHL